MFTSLYQEIVAMAEAVGGQHSAAPIREASIAANGRTSYSLSPVAPYRAILVHGLSFGGTVPETFQITLSQRMASAQTFILSEHEIRQGVAVLQGITTSSPGLLIVQNLDLINPHPFRAVVWQVNIVKEEELKVMLEAIRRRLCFSEIASALMR